MSDIPSGWYPDPEGLHDERYHDGTEWTSETRSAPKAAENAPTPAAPPPPPTTTDEEQRNTQRATMHYVRSLAILAALFVYISAMSVIVGLVGFGSASLESVPLLILAGLGGIALIVGLIFALIQFVSAFRTANEWANRLPQNPGAPRRS